MVKETWVRIPSLRLDKYFSAQIYVEIKKRIGWKLGQKREDRIDTANAVTTLWHNLYWLG